MQSNIIKITRDQDNLNKILGETQKTAEYADLSAKQTLRTRLIAEELIGMLKELSEDFDGDFWVEQEGTSFDFITRIYLHESMDMETKQKFIDVSTDKKNASAKGIMGKIRDIVENMLYPENARYLSDIIAYVAVGARSVENQQHRLTASGLAIPVGMKNPTGGDLSVMMNAITAAQLSHTFLYRGWEVTSEGNPLSHAILRGYIDFTGKSVSNYHYENLLHVNEMYVKSGLSNPSVIVDTNHNNSDKKYLEQIRIAKDVVHSRNQNGDIKRLVKGLMIESYLEDGAQGIDERIYGKSITDPCLGWDKTEQLIFDIADKL